MKDAEDEERGEDNMEGVHEEMEEGDRGSDSISTSEDNVTWLGDFPDWNRLGNDFRRLVKHMVALHNSLGSIIGHLHTISVQLSTVSDYAKNGGNGK